MDAVGLEFIMHRELVDRHVLLARVGVVNQIADAIRRDPAFVDDGDGNRQTTARRVAFVCWRLHERQGWHDALRNRREDRTR